jgi:CubicO group peptidase (beta-lactamase class C family)
MAKRRISTWITVVLLGVGLLLLAIPGLFVFMRVTAKTLHPDAQKIPSVANSAPPPTWFDSTEQGRKIVRASLSEQNLPGLSVAVGIDGEIVWAEGFGFANLEDSLPVTPNTRFRIGTASTLFTSTGVGLLLDQGKLNLDDHIQTYVPELPEKQWPVTIRQVMGDVAGLKTEDTDDGVLTAPHCERPGDAVALFAKDPLLFRPGTEYRFSVFGWVLMSAVLQAAADTPSTAFIENKIFRPLGMRDTVKESGTADPDEATSYTPRFAGNPTYGPRLLPKFDYSCYLGANGFLSTPSDLARFGMAISGGKLLRPDTVQILQAPQRLESGAETGHGLGWQIKNVMVAGQPVRAAGHDGYFWNGTVVSLLTLPERNMTVTVMSNISDTDTSSVAEKIAQAFAEQGSSARK